MSSSLNNQIRVLLDQGYTIEQIADSMNLDCEEVRFAIENSGKMVDLKSLDAELQVLAKKTLYDILTSPHAEHGVKLAASKIVLDGKGLMPEIDTNMLTERFRKMRQIASMTDKVIDITTDVHDRALAIREK